AKEAIDYYVFRIQREIGAMAASMGGINGLVFCGGIGENSAFIRQRICHGFDWMGIELDRDANAANAREVGEGRVRVLVVPTDEEVVLARGVLAVMG
ncbi:MAG: acetate kinase, partial [Ahrensia sp.]